MKNLKPVSSKRRRGQKGSSLLEGALALMAFLAMTFGLVEASMAIYAFNTVAYGAGAAARAAALHGATAPVTWSATDVQNFVRNQSPGLIVSRLTTTPTWPLDANGNPDKSVGGVVRVRVQYNVVPLAHVVFGNNFVISSTAQMTITQ